jgi:hypothetical protein
MSGYFFLEKLMILKLTSKLGNPILVNFDLVEDVELCHLKDVCSFEKGIGEFALGLRLMYTSGKSRIIRECLSDLEDFGVFS